MVFDIAVTDPDAYAHYLKVAGPVLAAGGGRFVFASNQVEQLEGGWQPESISVVAFDSAQAARDFYNSEAYRSVIGLRQSASRARGILAVTDEPDGT